jgi:hypothetical protein
LRCFLILSISISAISAQAHITKKHLNGCHVDKRTGLRHCHKINPDKTLNRELIEDKDNMLSSLERIKNNEVPQKQEIQAKKIAPTN